MRYCRGIKEERLNDTNFENAVTWRNDQTLGTLLITRRRGKLVGIDDQGNRYYEDKHGASINGKPAVGCCIMAILRQRGRLNVGWMHYTVDET